MTGAATAGMAVAAVLASIPAGSAERVTFPLLPLRSEQIAAAGAAGTGCAWSSSDGRKVMFAASDDHGVVRTADRIVSLRPAAGARDLFPFTYDGWTGGKVSVTIRPDGRAARRGSEAVGWSATLAVVVDGVATSSRGRLDCGS